MAVLRAIIWCAVSTKAQIDDEKFSLPAQEADARALAESKGWQVVDVLIVPGHSRRYKDFNELAAAAARKGIDAFYRLQEHWQRGDFDMLICRDGDRFARSQGLFGRIVEEVVESADAEIWSLTDGVVNKHNYRMWIAMVGYRAASDVDRLVKYRREAMNKRAEKGLPTSARIVESHRLIRDETGKAVKLVVDETKRRLWNDIATLLLEGVGFAQMERELYRRFGHVNDDGKPYRMHFVYGIIKNPSFWGHSSRYYSRAGRHLLRGATWVYDPSEPLPEGVMMFRNTHEAVYTGEQGERVIAELIRRTTTMRGKARPHATSRYSGLILCGSCTRYMVYHHHPPAMTCATNHYKRAVCYSEPHRTRMENVNRHIDTLLHGIVESGTLTDIYTDLTVNDHDQRLAELEKEIDGLESGARRLIHKQLGAPDSLSSMYDDELVGLGERLSILRSELVRLRSEQKRDLPSEQRTVEDLRTMTVEGFWKFPEREQNQFLHRIFGKRRLVFLNGEFKGTTDAPNRGGVKRRN